MTTNNQMPYNMNNELQNRLAREGRDVASFVNRMGNMSDQEIATELNISVNEARQMKQEFDRGQTGGYFIVD